MALRGDGGKGYVLLVADGAEVVVAGRTRPVVAVPVPVPVVGVVVVPVCVGVVPLVVVVVPGTVPGTEPMKVESAEDSEVCMIQ